MPFRLQPFLWSGRQTLAFSTVVGSACGAVAGIVDVWTFMPKSGPVLNFIVQAAWKIVLLGGISGLFCAFAAVSRNLVTRLGYFGQKLETLRATPWSYVELSLAGFWAFAVLPFLAVLIATRFFGLPMPNPNLALSLLESACAGAVYLAVVGSARNAWVRRRSNSTHRGRG